MTSVACEFGADNVEFKKQRASRRAVSLSKDQAKYAKQSLVSAKNGQKVSAVHAGSDFATPHRAARSATRTCLASGTVEGSSDMPQISMGRIGSSGIRVRKPSVCSTPGQHSLSINELTMDEYFVAPTIKSSQVCGNAPAACLQVSSNPLPIVFQPDFSDEEAFPALVHTGAVGAAQVPQGAWAVTSGKDEPHVAATEALTPEKLPQLIAEDAGIQEGLTPEKMAQLAPQKDEAADELAQDWIVVASDDAHKAAISFSQVGRASFNGQHPRNAFAKCTSSKRSESKTGPEDAGHGFDWSQPGMPESLLRRILSGSFNAAHHGIHSENRTVPLPAHIMHAQNAGSSKREKSTPSTPRSHSKPRTMRPSSRGR